MSLFLLLILKIREPGGFIMTTNSIQLIILAYSAFTFLVILVLAAGFRDIRMGKDNCLGHFIIKLSFPTAVYGLLVYEVMKYSTSLAITVGLALLAVSFLWFLFEIKVPEKFYGLTH